MHAVASSLSLCVANPPSVVWLRDCDQEPCVCGLGLFGHWHCWSCVLIDIRNKANSCLAVAHMVCVYTIICTLYSDTYTGWVMVGGERTTRASTASSLKLRRANPRRPLTHRVCVGLFLLVCYTWDGVCDISFASGCQLGFSIRNHGQPAQWKPRCYDTPTGPCTDASSMLL